MVGGDVRNYNRARWAEVSRYRDIIETFSFNVPDGYLIVEFNKMIESALEWFIEVLGTVTGQYKWKYIPLLFKY